jgi:hypothetical protein
VERPWSFIPPGTPGSYFKGANPDPDRRRPSIGRSGAERTETAEVKCVRRLPEDSMSDAREREQGVVRRADDGTSVVEAVLRGVSEATGTPVGDLDVELNDYVDPDAPSALFAPTMDGRERADGRVAFRMADCEVGYHAGDRAIVRPDG